MGVDTQSVAKVLPSTSNFPEKKRVNLCASVNKHNAISESDLDFVKRHSDKITELSSNDISQQAEAITSNLLISSTFETQTESVAIDLRNQKDLGSDVCRNSSINLESLCYSPESGRQADDESTTNKPQPRMLKFPPCEICNGKASGQHYGCNTCEACKNFFRRYLLRNQRYKCSKGNRCITSSSNKGNCSECRLTKCLELGMAKGKSKMGRYSYSRRTETINKVRLLEGRDKSYHMNNANSQSLQSFLPIVKEPELVSDILTVEEVDFIEKLIVSLDEIKPWGDELDSNEARQKCMQDHYDKYIDKVKTFGKMNNISKEEYQKLLRNFGIDLDDQVGYFKDCAKHWDRIVGHYCKFSKNIPGFLELSHADQEVLLKSTYFDFFTLLMHQGYNPELQVFIEINGKPYHIDETADKFFPRSFIVAMGDLNRRLQKLDISKQEMVLLVSIVTLSSDNYEIKTVENMRLVQSSQEYVSNILIKLLKNCYGETAGMKKFTKYVDCLLEIRTLGVVYSKEYSGLCQDDLFQGVIKEELIPMDILKNC